MKTAIAVLCIIGYALTAQGQPPKASYCQGNKDDLTTCSACLNTGDQARQFDATNFNCTTLIANKVTDCKWYNNKISATKALSDCMKCDGKTWLNLTAHNTAASQVIACSDTAIGTTDCAAAVDNCDQSVCYKSTGDQYSKLCGLCSSGYKPSGTKVGDIYPTCTAVTITDCDVGHPTDPAKCYLCKSGKMVNVAEDGCTTFDSDSNCRKLGTGNTYCGECNNGYYFE